MRTHLRGIVFGFAQSVPFFAYCGCMYYGGLLVQSEGLEYKKVFRYAASKKYEEKRKRQVKFIDMSWITLTQTYFVGNWHRFESEAIPGFRRD